jgi:UDP-glucose 4-epimerase
MNHLVLGGTGFIGGRVLKLLVQTSSQIIVLDRNEPTKELALQLKEKNVKFHRIDLAREGLEKIPNLCHELGDAPWTIWHLAANSDIRKGIENPSIDYLDTLGTTISAIQISKMINTSALLFASSSAVFGNQPGVKFSENHSILSPESNYGNMKLASEVILKINSESFSLKTRIFRFPNVIGWPTTHGVIHDFVANIKNDKSKLQVLGNGFQTKPYIHVDDLVEIMMQLSCTDESLGIYNIGPEDEGISVREIAQAVTEKISPTTQILYQDSPTGWVGDVPNYSFSTTKLRNVIPTLDLSSKSALIRTIGEM